METMALAVNPIDLSVYAAAGNKTSGGNGSTGILRSTDCGATWKLWSTGTSSDKLKTGDPWAIKIDPQHPQTMYVTNGYGDDPTVYKSTDGGVNWTPLFPDPQHVISTGVPFVQGLAMDPFNSQHLAVTFHADCGAPYRKWCFSQSTDGGATWHEFNGPTSVPGFDVGGWSEGATLAVLGPSSYLIISNQGVHFTSDGGNKWTLVMAYLDQGAGTHIAPDGTLYIGNSGGPIYYSAPAPGQNPPFAIGQAPSLPVPMPRLPYMTGLAPAVAPLMNAPTLTSIVDDGVNLYGSTSSNLQVYTAKLSKPTTWTAMPDKFCSGTVCRGPSTMAVDSSHHIIYSVNWGAGLWRLVTQ
jgi:photosystem II stability/assembly factor-like uncharacterized protein